MSKYAQMIQNKRFVSGKEMFQEVQNKGSVSSLLYNYRKRDIIVKIRKNVYLPTNPLYGYVDENQYEIGCNSVSSSYVSYHSAMAFYGWENQVFNRIYLSAPKRFRPFEFLYMEYMYAPDRFREGVVKDETRAIYYTELERTIIDCADRLDLAGGYEEFIYNLDFVSKVNEDKLIRYLSLYNKQALYQRAGFILSRLQKHLNLSDSFFELCKEKTGKSVRYLTHKHESKVYIPEWKLYVPQYLLTLTKYYVTTQVL
jgi:predicted transcriptional regulator of viral defense system